MRLIELKIENFRVIKSARIFFDQSVIGIIGRNGAGKSSIIESIAWAIYGNQAARTGKDQIKSSFAKTTDVCRVALKFEVRGEKYEVIRKLSGKSDRAEVELYRDGKAESVGVSDTKDHVGELLGLDWNGFKSSFLAQQQELNALADLQPAKRKDHLAMMLGVERLDKAAGKVKEESRSLAKQSDFIERQLGQKETIEKLIAENEAELKQKEIEFKETDVAFQRSKFGKEKIAESLKLLQNKKAQFDLLAVETKSLKQVGQSTGDEIREHGEKKQALLEIRDKIEPMKAKLGRLENSRKLFKKAEANRAREESLKSLEKQLAALSGELDKTEERLAASDQSSKTLTEALADYPGSLPHELAGTENSLEQARQEYSAKNGELLAVESDLNKTTKQLDSVEQLGPGSVCDRCQRPFGDDYESIKHHLAEEAAKLKQAQKKLAGELAQVKTKGESVRANLDKLKERLNRREELLRQIEATNQKISELNENRTGLTERITKLTEEISEFAFEKISEADYQKLKEAVAEYDELQKELSRAEGSIEGLGQLEESLGKAQSRLAQIVKDIEAKESALSALSWNPTEFDEAAERFARAEAEFAHVSEKYAALKSRCEILANESKTRREQLARFSSMAEELEEQRVSRFHLEKLAALMADYRTLMISRIRPTLSDISSRLVSEMTDGKYGMVELDEKYNLRLFDYGEYFEVVRFSGGEKDLASLCLRLAISQMLTQAAGLDQSFILLDEVFGSQDDGRRGLIVDALKNLRQRFPQIILITHIEDLKQQVETLIEVEQTPQGWSEVRQDGAA